MNKIHKFSDYSLYQDMFDNLVSSFSFNMNESKDDSYEKVANDVLSDLKINIKLITTFGAGIGGFYPIVEGLMRNFPSIEVNIQSVVLLTICAISIIYLDEQKEKGLKQDDALIKDSKSMLEELKMKGIGNGIVKKLIKALQSIKNIFSFIGKYLGIIVTNFFDMFTYTSLLIPIMNGIASTIGKYDLNFDTLVQNFIGLAMGLGGLVTKHGIREIIRRLKGKFSLNKEFVVSHIEDPLIMTSIDKDHEMDSVDVINDNKLR